MTAVLALLCAALVALALLADEWLWQRRVAKQTARRTPTTLRCLCCEGAPLVEDIATHTRLVHQPRERAAEDFPEWSNR